MTHPPEDTSARPGELHLLGSLVEGPDNYIADMEAAGQRELVNSDVLPRDLNGGNLEDYEALGFTFGERTDDLFRAATLPPGWRREGSGHNMWSKIVDERGIERVAIFYKAAFYDRSAHMNIVKAGRHYATQLIWGDDGVDATPYDVLTIDELADMHDSMRQRVEDGRDDEYTDRARRWLDAHPVAPLGE